MKFKIKLSNVTTYKFGGYCENFYKISEDDVDSFKEVFSSNENFILGRGSNVAFSDDGYEGNIINPNFDGITYDDNFSELRVGASIFLPDLARYYKTNNLVNAEFLIGIPGSVGGAAKMNAGAYGWEFSDIIKSLEVYNLDNNKIEILLKEDINYGYRSSNNLERKIVMSAILSANEGDPELISRRLKENIVYRKKTQPAAIYNAGSVFKNTKDYSAGELIDKSGLKGYSIDGVKVSKKHANFFIASKGANAASLYKLVNHVKDVVDSKYGVSLEKEIIFVGKFD
jgi:UDP-N-acetylmuramate dehydrogenase